MRIASSIHRVAAAAAIAAGALAMSATAASAHHTFGAESGFDRNITVTVQRTPGIDVDGVIAPWNVLAGRALFAAVDTNAHITFVRGPVTYVAPSPHYTGRYTSCTVYYASARTRLLSHELGHCLGFADHVGVVQLNPHYINPAICDDPRHPAYDSYQGIMSYCSWSTAAAFGADDRAMLERAGYTGVEEVKPDRPVLDRAEARAMKRFSLRSMIVRSRAR